MACNQTEQEQIKIAKLTNSVNQNYGFNYIELWFVFLFTANWNLPETHLSTWMWTWIFSDFCIFTVNKLLFFESCMWFSKPVRKLASITNWLELVGIHLELNSGQSLRKICYKRLGTDWFTFQQEITSNIQPEIL